jgi:Domain of unknown function (DUF4139)/N-terminal domain of unknown function (DUF4140)
MKVASQLEAVTVYARGAVCERTATLPAGAETKFTVTGLPMSLRAASVRARTRGGSVTVLEVRPGFAVAMMDALDASAEQKALDVAEAELARLALSAARVQREIDHLNALAPSYRAQKEGDPPREAPVEATLALAAFVAETLPALQAEKRALDEKHADASREVQLRRSRLAEASSAAARGPVQIDRTAEVVLSAAPTAPITLVVEYQVPGARWAPAYELQLGAGLAPGLLSMRAAVAQCTGEDWVGVRLALSTADLDRRIEKLSLRSIRIGRSQPPAPRSGWRDPPPGLDALFADFDVLSARRPSLPSSTVAVSLEKRAKKGGRADKSRGGPPPPPPPAPPRDEPSLEDELSIVPEVSASYEMDERAEGAPSMPMTPPAAPARRSATGSMQRMAPMAPSASLAAPAPAMLRKRASPLGGVVNAAMEAFGGPPGAGGGGMRADMDDGAAAPPPEPELTVDGALLDYDLLRMPGPSESNRGRLQPGSVIAFQAISLKVQVEVLTAVVSLNENAAWAVDQLQLPPHARAPRESAGTFDYRYACSAPVDVPSVAAWRVLPVATADVEIAAAYQCVPSVEPKVYRTVSMKNRSEHALLSGPVDVFVGGGFLLTAQLPTLPPQGDGETLGLGVEEAIKVARNTAFRETTGGLLGGSTVLPHEITIDVENRTGRPATIEVRERVPVTTDDDIKVEEVKVEPPWRKDEQPRDGRVIRGARSWRITVAPGEKKSLFAEFSVKIPSSKMLQGGNRRV